MIRFLVGGFFNVYFRGFLEEKRVYIELEVGVNRRADACEEARIMIEKDYMSRYGREIYVEIDECHIIKEIRPPMEVIRKHLPKVPLDLLEKHKSSLTEEDLWEIAKEGNDDVVNWTIDELLARKGRKYEREN